MRRVAQQTNQDPARLYALPETTPEYLYLWRHYCQIKQQEALTFREVEAWQNLTGIELSPGELGILFMLDAVFYESRRQDE